MLEIINESALTAQQNDIWRKAKQAINSNNTAYAINLLKALVKNCPAFLDARKLLRSCEITLNPTPKKKGGLFGGLSLSKTRKDPMVTLSSVEDDMENDPFSVAANEALYSAALALGNIEMAAFALETIRAGHPENVKMLELLSNLYMDNEMPDRAVDVYRDILKQEPANSNAIKGEKDAAARASMKSQRWEEATSFKDVMKNSGQTSDLEKSDKQGMTRQEMEERLGKLSARYAENQQDIFVVRDIASIYEQMEDWANAYSFYAYAYTLSANDMSLSDKSSIMHTRMLDQQLSNLEKLAAQDPNNEELQAQLTQCRQERSAEQVAEANRRVENNPTDPQLRFELGQALYGAGEYTDAIPQLQKARNNPHIRTKAMLLLGKCYDAKSMHDMALRQLEEANAELHAMDATKKDVLYLMGSIYDKMGKAKEALDSFKVIYDADYGYKDVAQRVETSYKS